jgi:hypothetical protein
MLFFWKEDDFFEFNKKPQGMVLIKADLERNKSIKNGHH